MRNLIIAPAVVAVGLSLTGCGALASGEYSCLTPGQYEMEASFEEMGIPMTYDPREPEWVAYVSQGEVDSVTVFEGMIEIGADLVTREASDFYIEEKIDSRAFVLQVEGEPAICTL